MATNMTDLAWLSRVARELGSNWSDEANGDGSYWVLGWLNGPAGMRIAVQQSGKGRAWRFHPLSPTPPSTDAAVNVKMPPAIGFGFGRDPAAVARRIVRELEPGYRRQIAKHAEAVAAAQGEAAAKARAGMRLSGALDGLSTNANNGALHYYGPGGAATRSSLLSVDFKLNHDGSEATVELRWCPTDLAVDIAELVQRYVENEVTS